MKALEKQRGSLLIDILIGGAAIAFIVITFVAIVGQRSASIQATQGVDLIMSSVPISLNGLYYRSGRSYALLTADDAGAAALINEGTPEVLPWGDRWAVTTAGSGNPPTVEMTFPCRGARDPVAMCRTVSIRIANYEESELRQASILNASFDPDEDPAVIRVLYSRPR